ncbi:MAG: histidine phosphatase family protein [Dehalococcoidales bacterium]|nr:histidine phosphatase family protein [Dehalococcoidales bacterium]
MVTTLILVRHGETDWNRDEIFRGRADIELNATGVRQAELLAGYLAGAPVEAVYASPLRRALKTAEILAAPHHLGVTPAEELIDFDYGRWQGLSHESVKKTYPVQYERWRLAPHLARIPEGETLGRVRKRTLSLVERIKDAHRGTVVLVSHRVILKVLICALLGLSNARFWNIRLDTCGITVFGCTGNGFVLEKHNDTSFLKPLGLARAGDF